jgi:uncharacterized membrane protein YfcA
MAAIFAALAILHPSNGVFVLVYLAVLSVSAFIGSEIAARYAHESSPRRDRR